MKTIKKVFNFYVFSNIHVALACFCLTKLSLLYWQNNSNSVPLFVFFATIASYNYIRLTRQKNIKSWLSNWLIDYKRHLTLLTVISILGGMYYAFKFNLKAFFILMPFASLTFLYVLPSGFSKNLNLRNLPALKIFVIALSWAGITVLFPLFQYEIFNEKVLWLFLQRFLFVVVLTIPFDIRDIPYDSKNLLTLPHLLGLRNVKILGLLFLGISVLIEIFVFGTNNIWIIVFIAICLSFLLFRATDNQTKYYSAFWVESIPILWLVLYYFV